MEDYFQMINLVHVEALAVPLKDDYRLVLKSLLYCLGGEPSLIRGPDCS